MRTDPTTERRLAPTLPARRPVDAVGAQQRAESFTKRSIKKQSKLEGLRRALSMLDLTTLEGKDSPEKVRALCRKAMRPADFPADPPLPSVAAVCVYPTLVRVAKETLGESGVKVASVATGFPSGQFPLDVRLADVRFAVAEGADEIDMVISRGLFLAGQHREVMDEIRAIKHACGPAHLKIILETGELETLDAVRFASDLAIEAAVTVPANGTRCEDGEVFIKTSTGKVTPAATMPVTLVMLEAIRDAHRRFGIRIGMKPAGGIRTAKSALHYLVMVQETLGPEWLSPHLFRFGASTLANDLLRQVLKEMRGPYVGSGDLSEA
ncbi:MAG: deoxyribose-phosphate aldolase [Phycisphaerae bacterium]|jgi:deoxyribose-phosphate aldolase|nr:deoxyribose-phosphate aldolase [Phycisphaerae bacterium]